MLTENRKFWLHILLHESSQLYAAWQSLHQFIPNVGYSKIAPCHSYGLWFGAITTEHKMLQEACLSVHRALEICDLTLLMLDTSYSCQHWATSILATCGKQASVPHIIFSKMSETPPTLVGMLPTAIRLQIGAPVCNIDFISASCVHWKAIILTSAKTRPNQTSSIKMSKDTNRIALQIAKMNDFLASWNSLHEAAMAFASHACATEHCMENTCTALCSRSSWRPHGHDT